MIGICLATGQAAGTAAALSAKRDIPARALDIRGLQASLAAQGAVLFD